MTRDEAYLRFRVDYDAIASLQAPQLEIDEINSLMNQSYMSLIIALNKSKMFDDLRELVVVEVLDLLPCTIEKLGSFAFQANSLASEFLFHIESRVFIAQRDALLDVSNEWMSCSEIARKDANYWIQQPGNCPVILYPKVFFHFANANTTPVVMTDKHVVIGTIDSYQVTYIKIPVPIDLTPQSFSAPLCELSPDWHEAIVNEAVNLAIKATDEDRIKMNVEQKQKKAKG